MTVTVTNQKPAVLDPVHHIAAAGPYDPMPAIEKTVVDPLRAPLSPAAPALIVDAKGNDVSADLPDMLMACLGEDADPTAEAAMKDVLAQTLVHFDRKSLLPVGELFAVQAGAMNRLPPPSPTTIYSASVDVVPAAKALLAGSGTGEAFFADLAFSFHPETLGFWFQTPADFEGFKAFLAAQVQLMGAQTLPADTIRLLGDVQKLSLNGLTESLLIRKDDADGNDEFSFPRLVVHFLMAYVEDQRAAVGQAGHFPAPMTVGVLPFTLGELFCPRSLVFVNVEAHARASGAKVSKEWQLINQSINSPVKVVSNKALAKLTALPRAAAKAQQAGVLKLKGQPGARSASVAFRRKPPTSIDLTKDLMRVLRRMGQVNRSQNVIRTARSTFLKANRRDPDDFNKKGRILSTSYLPDIHVYIDTSGSISEENYQEAVMMLIRVAKKLNVNLYFNSFSHVMSQETLLRVQNRSASRIWQEFRKVPKVTGGTEFKQVWDYIQATPKRRRQLSLMITDFEWYPPSARVDHPKNLYYAPCSSMNWNWLVHEAGQFAKGMTHIDPSIRQRLLGMNV